MVHTPASQQRTEEEEDEEEEEGEGWWSGRLEGQGIEADTTENLKMVLMVLLALTVEM